MDEVSLSFLKLGIFHHLEFTDNYFGFHCLKVEAAVTYHRVKMTVYVAAKLCHYQFKSAFALLLGIKQQFESSETHQTRTERQEYKSSLQPKCREKNDCVNVEKCGDHQIKLTVMLLIENKSDC